MRKIYLSGLVAMAIGAMFTSCSKDNDLFDENAVEEGKIQKFEMEVAQKRAAYNEAFAKEFGTIASGHDWGFGSAVTRAAIAGADGINGFFALPEEAGLVSQLNNGNNNKFGQAIYAVFQKGYLNLKAGKAFNNGMTKEALNDKSLTNGKPFGNKSTGSIQVSNGYLTMADVIADLGNLDSYYLQHVYKNVASNPQHNDFDKLYARNFNYAEDSNEAWEYVTNFEKGKNNSIFFENQNLSLKGYTMMAGMGTMDASKNFLKWDFKAGTSCRDYKIVKIEGDYYIGFNDPEATTNGNTLEQGEGSNYCSWIIRIAKAVPSKEIITKKQGRVFCEDMGEIGDFDFNDLVFDGEIKSNGDIEIEVLAAGGIYDYQIDGQDVTLGKMTNTGVNDDDSQFITIKRQSNGVPKYSNLRDIPITVYPNGKTAAEYHYTLGAGEDKSAPQKFCTYVGIEWAEEYVNINRAYPKFKEWVNKYNPIEWGDQAESRYIDLILGN